MAKGVPVAQRPAVQRITSVKNSCVQHCVKLRTKKGYRESCQRLLLVGREVIEEVLNSEADVKMRSLFLRDGADLIQDERVRGHVFYVAHSVMEKLSGMQTPPADAAVAELDFPVIPEDWQSRHVLALDGIQDPGNVGTLLRTAVCFDWGPVLLLPSCCDAYNDKVLKAAKGSVFKVPVITQDYGTLPSLLKAKRLMPVAATIGDDGVEVDEVLEHPRRRDRGLCLFLGGEGRGLSEKVEQLCARRVQIPQSSQMESLNVAVAGGILMYLMSHFKGTQS